MKEALSSLAQFVPCHRKPERCLKYKGKPMLICARCFSMLLGYLFIPVLFLLPFPYWLGFVFQLPMMIDGYTQYKKMRISNNFLRVTTGLTSGIGLSMIIVSFVRIVIGL